MGRGKHRNATPSHAALTRSTDPVRAVAASVHLPLQERAGGHKAGGPAAPKNGRTRAGQRSRATTNADVDATLASRSATLANTTRRCARIACHAVGAMMLSRIAHTPGKLPSQRSRPTPKLPQLPSNCSKVALEDKMKAQFGQMWQIETISAPIRLWSPSSKLCRHGPNLAPIPRHPAQSWPTPGRTGPPSVDLRRKSNGCVLGFAAMLITREDVDHNGGASNPHCRPQVDRPGFGPKHCAQGSGSDDVMFFPALIVAAVPILEPRRVVSGDLDSAAKFGAGRTDHLPHPSPERLFSGRG